MMKKVIEWKQNEDGMEVKWKQNISIWDNERMR